MEKSPVGAPRSMKMGTIRSPWRYDRHLDSALRFAAMIVEFRDRYTNRPLPCGEPQRSVGSHLRAGSFSQTLPDGEIREQSMDAVQILDRLADRPSLPIEALRAAGADRVSAAAIFLDAIEEYLAPGGRPIAPDALFFVFHLLGEWQEKSAYRPLARLLRCPGDKVDSVLGGAITETAHRVMAAVFDGDPDPLYQIILDAEADEFIRSRMCEALAMATFDNETQRADTARFLRACYSELKPQAECFVWHGWQSAIALLGLAELKPLVEQAFARGLISTTWLSFAHFEQDLELTIKDPSALASRSHGEFSLFGDTIEELSDWYCFSSKAQRNAERASTRLDQLASSRPIANPLRKVGRNDPCPCGSGRKFKKCCLLNEFDLTALRAV